MPGAVEPAQSEKIVNNSNVSRPGAVQFNRLRRFGWLHVFVFAVSPWRALPESFFLRRKCSELRCCGAHSQNGLIAAAVYAERH